MTIEARTDTKPRSLRSGLLKVTSAFSLSGLVLVLLASALSLREIKNQVRVSNLHFTESMARSVSESLLNSINALRITLSFAESDPVTLKHLKNSDIAHLLEDLSSFNTLILLSKRTGVVLATLPESAELVGTDLSRQDFFGQANMTHPTWGKSTLPLTGDPNASTIALASKNFIILGVFDLKKLNKLPFSLNRSLAVTHLIDRNGVIIASSDEQISALSNNISNTKAFKMISSDVAKSYSASTYEDLPSDVHGSLHGEQGFISVAKIQNTSWYLMVIEEKLAELKMLDRIQIFLLCFVGVLGLLSTIFMLVSFNRILTPLRRMVEKARDISIGSYRPRISAEFEELEPLSEALNRLSENLQNREQRLAETTQVCTRLLENMRDGYVMTDLNGRIINCNKAFADLLGLKRDALLERNLTEISAEASREMEQKIIYNTVIPRGYSDVFEKDFIHSTGKLIPVEVRITAEKASDDSTTFWFIARDLTARKIAEAEAKKTLEQLTQISKLASIGQLAAGVGHEINNPLQIIQANSELLSSHLQRRNALDEKAKNTLEKVFSAINRIIKIIEDLRHLVRKDETDPHPVNCHALIKASTSLIAELLEKTEIKLNLNLNAASPIVLAHPGQLQQVIMNLITNAKDALASRPHRLINISTRNDSHALIVTISDTGEGIPNNIRDRIFDSFFTTKEPGKGVGLGLALAHSFITKMGGQISFESELNVGTTFTIRLPTMNAPAETPPVA